MTVELVHALYGINEDDEPVATAYETPEWYLRGMAHFTDRDGTSRTAPMHAHLTLAGDELDYATVQLICDPALIRSA